MNRRNRFLIGLLSAAITFGTLAALAGPMHWQRRGWHRGYYHHGCYDEARQQNYPTNQ